ncbi:DUF4236 domain-containing protein [Fontivita pretiosa]|uniref:DUF4236 domain-containing protein n=1 Tax=Fontivita pretiosa TaxID=2989684 RepID=UPI003D17DAC8
MWRFRKILGRGPFRLTLSKRGVGWSCGIPGFRYGVSPSGQRYISFRIPGTGLYWIRYLKQKSDSSVPPPAPLPGQSAAPPNSGSIPASPGRKVPWWRQKGI